MRMSCVKKQIEINKNMFEMEDTEQYSKKMTNKDFRKYNPF